MGILCFKRNDIKGGEGRGAWLRGDHSPEACHVPRTHVIVLRADGDQVFLAKHHFDHWIAMNHECLEELWSMAYSLWVLYNHSDGSRAGTICYLNPITT